MTQGGARLTEVSVDGWGPNAKEGVQIDDYLRALTPAFMHANAFVHVRTHALAG